MENQTGWPDQLFDVLKEIFGGETAVLTVFRQPSSLSGQAETQPL
jgi:hypothetical protein